MKDIDGFEDLDVDGKIILNLILRKFDPVYPTLSKSVCLTVN